MYILKWKYPWEKKWHIQESYVLKEDAKTALRKYKSRYPKDTQLGQWKIIKTTKSR
jgi:hypothetical protein